MNYKEYKGLLKKLAAQFCYEPEDFDDMMSVCNEAYCKAILHYQPEKGKFSTILYHYATRALIDEIRKKKTKYEKLEPLPLKWEMLGVEAPSNERENKYPYMFTEALIDEKQDNERRHEFRTQLESLSQEAQEMISLILNSPYELFEGAKSLSPKYLRGQVIKMMRDRKWKWNVIYSSIKEIKNAIQNFK